MDNKLGNLEDTSRIGIATIAKGNIIKDKDEQANEIPQGVLLGDTEHSLRDTSGPLGLTMILTIAIYFAIVAKAKREKDMYIFKQYK